MKEVLQESAENRVVISALKEESIRQQKGLDTLVKSSEEFRKQVGTLNDRVDELPVLKQQVKV